MPITIQKADEQLRNLHKRISECQQWIIDNYTAIQTKYPDEHIAVLNKQVIDHDKDLNELLKRLHKDYFEISDILIRFISKEKITLVI